MSVSNLKCSLDFLIDDDEWPIGVLCAGTTGEITGDKTLGDTGNSSGVIICETIVCGATEGAICGTADVAIHGSTGGTIC